MAASAGFDDDYRVLSAACGLLDRSERGKLALDGAGAKEFLQGQLSNDVASVATGSGVYATFLDHKGRMQGDLRVLDAGAMLLLDTERSALQNLFNMIRRQSIGHDVRLHKRTLECGLLSLIGPSCDVVLTRAAQASAPGGPGGSSGTHAPRGHAATPLDTLEQPPVRMLPAAAEHAHATLALAGTEVRAIRTDLGIDVLLDAADVGSVREALLAAGARAVGEQAAECVRIESGRPRYGVDLDQRVMPQEAGLIARAVSFTKGCYVGQEPVARLHYKGRPNRQLRGLLAEEPIAVGAELSLGERHVATVTSACVSPRLGAIALALVRREAPPGSTLKIAPGGHSCTVVELPFP